MVDFAHSSARLHYDAEVCLTPPVSSSTARSIQTKKVSTIPLQIASLSQRFRQTESVPEISR